MEEITTPLFWDCECKNNYIHLKSKVKRCGRCGSYFATSPDSRVIEVAAMLSRRKR